MLQEVFCLSGGRFSGTYLLPGLMRSTQRLQPHILRLVLKSLFIVLILCKPSFMLNMSRMMRRVVEIDQRISIIVAHSHFRLNMIGS